MYVPVRSAAAMSSSPGFASMAVPLMVTVTVSLCTSVSATRAAPFLDVEEVLVAEVLERRHDRPRRRLAERADRRSLRGPRQADVDVVRDVEQQLEVLLATVPVLDAVHRLLQPARAFAA